MFDKHRRWMFTLSLLCISMFKLFPLTWTHYSLVGVLHSLQRLLALMFFHHHI